MARPGRLTSRVSVDWLMERRKRDEVVAPNVLVGMSLVMFIVLLEIMSFYAMKCC